MSHPSNVCFCVFLFMCLVLGDKGVNNSTTASSIANTKNDNNITQFHNLTSSKENERPSIKSNKVIGTNLERVNGTGQSSSTFYTDGGPIKEKSTPVLTKPEKEETKVETSVIEPISNYKNSQETAKSSIVPRKGANIEIDSDDSHEKMSKNVTLPKQPDTVHPVSEPTIVSSSAAPAVKEVVPKKPLKTIGTEEVLMTSHRPPSSESAPKSSTSASTQRILSSAETVKVLESMEHPRSKLEDISQFSKGYFDPTAHSRVGFVIPLVLSLLAVPVLGLVAYQAVRRAREAWRNRHYRRMDFLIDGMYND